MRGRILTLATITLILISTQGTVANPGGEGDGNRDFVCGGSCHGDPTLSAPSTATISIHLEIPHSQELPTNSIQRLRLT